MAMKQKGGGCGCGKTIPKYSNNPRSMQGRVLRDGGMVNAYMTGGTMKGDKVTKGSMYRRGAEVKVMKKGGYK